MKRNPEVTIKHLGTEMPSTSLSRTLTSAGLSASHQRPSGPRSAAPAFRSLSQPELLSWLSVSSSNSLLTHVILRLCYAKPPRCDPWLGDLRTALRQVWDYCGCATRSLSAVLSTCNQRDTVEVCNPGSVSRCPVVAIGSLEFQGS